MTIMNKNPILEPGCYSLFILIEDGTWHQRTFRITYAMSQGEFETMASFNYEKVVYTCGVQEDNDCPEEQVEELK